MLVNLYSAKTPIAVFSLPIVVAILSIPILLVSPADNHYFIDWQTVLSDWVLQYPLLNYGITVLLVSTIAHQINNVYNRHIFYSKATFLPGFIYVLCLFSLQQLFFSPNIIAHLFLVFALGFLLKTKRQEAAKTYMFWAGISIGVAIGFSTFQLILLLLPWFTLAIIRPFVWREWFMLILGGGIPLLYYLSIIYLSTGEIAFLIVDETQTVFPEMDLFRAANYGVFGIVVLGTFFKYFTIMRSEVNRFRKLSQIIFHFLWLSSVSWIIGWYFFDLVYISFLIPLSFFIATPMLHAKRSQLTNGIVIIWLIISVANVLFGQQLS